MKIDELNKPIIQQEKPKSLFNEFIDSKILYKFDSDEHK